MASLVGKRRMTDINSELSSASSKRWCHNPENEEKAQFPSQPNSLIIPPDNQLTKLKTSFPTFEDKALEEALAYSNQNIKAAPVVLQRERPGSPPSDQQMEEKKHDVPMSTAATSTPHHQKRANLIELFLQKMEKVQSREEAYSLTELLLKRYKGNLGDVSSAAGMDLEKMETGDGAVSHQKQNKVLKKGMQILVQRYNTLQQTLQKETEKTKELEKKEKATKDELNYYKSLAGTLANTWREGTMSRPQMRYNPDSDVY